MIRGFVDHVEPTFIAGWAYDRENPTAPLTVTVVRGAQQLGTSQCDLFRADLLKAYGHGEHGFTFQFDPPLEATELDDIAVMAGDHVLEWTKDSVAGGPSAAEIEAHAQPQTPEPQPPAQVPEPSPDIDEGEHFPIFVIGSERTGTTAMITALASATGFESFPEGHVFEIAGKFFEVVGTFYSQKMQFHAKETGSNPVMIDVVNQEYMESLVCLLMQRIATDVFKGDHWLDKTPGPEMVAIAPTLRHIWPNAKFIFMQRRGIDNIMSRLRKFKYEEIDAPTFIEHCQEWTRTMELWEQVRQQVSDCSLEIDQYFLEFEPTETANAVGEFLGLLPAQTHGLAGLFSKLHPERTVEQREIVSLAETGWSEREIEVFLQICGPAMERYGYDLGPNYFRDDSNLEVAAGSAS